MIRSAQVEAQRFGRIKDDFPPYVFRSEIIVIPVTVRVLITGEKGSSYTFMSTADISLFSVSPVAPDADFRCSFQLRGWHLCDDVDHAARGIVAIEDTPGSSYDFHPFDLTQRNLRPINPAQINLIHTTPIH